MSKDEKVSTVGRSFVTMFTLLIIAGMLSIAGVIAGAYFIVNRYHQYVYWSSSELTAKDTNPPSTAVVLGSGITPEGEPRPILKKRLDATLELYNEGLLDRIIVSGYHPYKTYNEPVAMMKYLAKAGVSERMITKDTSGNNTFATCYQAKNEFNVDRVIIVSQPSHLDRAIFLCRSLGVEAYGYPAELKVSRSSDMMQSARESISNVKAVYEIAIYKLKNR